MPPHTSTPTPPYRQSLPWPWSDRTAGACVAPPALRPVAFPASATPPPHPATPALPSHRLVGPADVQWRAFPVLECAKRKRGRGRGSLTNRLIDASRTIDIEQWKAPKLSVFHLPLQICFEVSIASKQEYGTHLVGLFQPHGNFSVLGLANFFRPPQALDHALPLPP